MAATTPLALALPLLLLSISTLVNSLSPNYYDQSCPGAESKITGVVKKAMMNDRTVPAALLRMHFHDCFIRGCDGSVLLNSTSKNKAEKDGPPNISLHAFYVIDVAKKEVEAMCPSVVSCADILALAARDAVALSGGPNWQVPKGRKDGRISKAIDTRQLPAPTFNLSQLQQSFSQRGLSLDDLVALSGVVRSQPKEGLSDAQQGKRGRRHIGFDHNDIRQRLLQVTSPGDEYFLLRPSFALCSKD
ncbi:hypothetical protein C3L33_09449, partial [Rhododendron williamsianum]